ncbi:hypothetical protein [Bacillus subtilis]|uniref:hypothetical protein n=1 Tax=Bacillus subtilis TaxID=1423 RepID=UPI00084A2989|nr:hypothetical protein [Bacillus subtilis]ODV47935.1 hypothetical protein BCM26_05875 [Bacillus subtilis]OJH63533.1 hypothetical protein BOH71_09820 [Bacillus subtilis]
MMEQVFHWCNKCDQAIQFNRNKDFEIRNEVLEFKGETIVVEVKKPICPNCKEEIFDEKLADEAMKKAVELWEKQTGRKFK